MPSAWWKLWQNISIRFFSGKLLKTMLRYSLPLVPAMMFWWVTNASDRYFITFMCGPEQNGLYAAAYKVPSMVVLFSTIFTEAWQMSAVTDGQGPGRHRFFTTVFQSLSAVTFIGGGVLIWACRFVMQFLVAPGYYRAWEYIPFLVCATVFSCLVAFLNSVYMVEKRSMMSLVTMLAGALANIGLNALLIPIYGPHGAAMATFASYVLVFIIRALHTQQFVQIQFQPFKMLLNTTLLLVMCLIMVGEPPLWPLWCGFVFAALLMPNALPLYRGFRQVLRRRRGKEAAEPPKRHSLPPRH